MEEKSERSKHRRNREDDRKSGSRDRSRSRSRDREDDRHSRHERRHDNKYDEGDSYSGDDWDRQRRSDSYRSDGGSYVSGTPGSTIGRGGGKGRWYNSIPNNIVLVRELPEDAVENDIIEELAKSGMHVKDVRVMRSKETGQSLRYCFVEFNQVSDAQYWMEVNQGEMRFRDAFTLSMYYSTTRRGNLSSAPAYDPNVSDSNLAPCLADWTCNKCNCTNFQRRTHCRRCSHAKEEFERGLRAPNVSDGQDQVGINPCNTLILRGLDGLTTEENIINAFAKATSYPVKNVRVIRDGLTGASNGYAFVEMTSLKESKDFVEFVTQQDTPLEVDGKAVIIAYAKNTFTTALATLESQKQQQLNYHAQQQGYYDYNAYYNAYQAAHASADMSTAANSTNAAAALAQAAIMQNQQKQRTYQAAAAYAAPTAGSQQGTTGYTIYPVPDVSTYTYDETSGYYYDASTGLYYDPNTQYYYNPEAQIFMYWDGEKRTYLPAPTGSGSGMAEAVAQSSLSSNTQAEENKEIEVEDEKKKCADKKVKVAKKIAKDMEKWAKKMNAQKESHKEEINRNMPGMQGKSQSAAADAGFSLLEKSSYKSATESSSKEAVPAAAVTLPSSAAAATAASTVASTVAATAEPSAGPSRVESSAGSAQQSAASTEEELTDWTKIACLLCRRAFPSKDVLIKHQQLSDLHKSNLQDLINSRAKTADNDTLSQALQYRDRAKERRDKYGVPEPPLPSKKAAKAAAAKEPIPFEQPTQDGLKDDNIGNKLLQKMGWKDGMGLGRGNQGIVNPIEAKQRHASAGLGARGSAYNIDPASGTYKDRARKTFQMYFQEIN